MRCSVCGCIESKVIDSRINEASTLIRRRRECVECGKRFTTYEAIETRPIYVIKKSGARQAFSAAKVKSGILKSCEKRPVSIMVIDQLVDEITKTIENSLEPEISSDYIGDLVMEGLKEIDEVAYVRFAAVHREFKDINSWLSEIEEVIKTRDAEEAVKRQGTEESTKAPDTDK